MAGIVDLDEGFNLIDPKDNVAPEQEFEDREETGVSILYNKETPLNTILNTLSGYRWSVNYYNQLRDINDTLTQFDVTSSATIQKYNKIKNMLLYVQTPLGLDNAESLNGEALIRGDFLPNVHDVFIANLPGGRRAMFSVTNVEDKTSNLNKIYSITYSILHYIDDKKSLLLKNLEHKVMKTYVYDNKHLSTRSSPLVLEATYRDKINLEDSYREMMEYYLKHFLNDLGVITLPTTDGKVYTDIFLVDFLLKTCNTSDFLEFSRLNKIPVNKVDDKPYTVFDIILNRRKKDLVRAELNMGYKQNRMLYYNGTVYFLYNRVGINYIMVKGKDPVVIEKDGEKFIETDTFEPVDDLKDLSTYSKYFPDEVIEKEINMLGIPDETKTEEDLNEGQKKDDYLEVPEVEEPKDEEDSQEETKPSRPPTKIEEIFQQLQKEGEGATVPSQVSGGNEGSTSTENTGGGESLLRETETGIEGSGSGSGHRGNTDWTTGTTSTVSEVVLPNVTPKTETKPKSKLEQIFEELKKKEEAENASKPKPEEPKVNIEVVKPDDTTVAQPPAAKYEPQTDIEKIFQEINKITNPSINDGGNINAKTKIEEIYEQLKELEKIQNTTNGNTTGNVQGNFVIHNLSDLEDTEDEEIEDEEEDVENEEVVEDDAPSKPKGDLEVEDNVTYEAPILDVKRAYIFSEYFYKDDRAKCGLVERLVLDYLEDKSIADVDIFKISTQYHMWNTQDQYNLIPIGLFLIKYYLQTIDKG